MRSRRSISRHARTNGDGRAAVRAVIRTGRWPRVCAGVKTSIAWLERAVVCHSGAKSDMEATACSGGAFRFFHAPRSTLYAPCSMLRAPCSVLHAPRSTLHASSVRSLHGPRSPTHCCAAVRPNANAQPSCHALPESGGWPPGFTPRLA